MSERTGDRERKQRTPKQALAQQPPTRLLTPAARHLRLDQVPADVDQLVKSGMYSQFVLGYLTYNGKLYGVPYYAGDRIVIYRKSMFAKAGIATPPTTTAQLVSDAQALNTAESSVSHFSPIYVAGKYWYGIFSWIFDAGGGIAQQVNGKWQGQFSSPADQTALTWVHSLFTQGLDKAPGDADETNDDKVFEAGKAAMIIEPGWDYGVVKGDFTKAKNTAAANDLGVFVIPGQNGLDLVLLLHAHNRELRLRGAKSRCIIAGCGLSCLNFISHLHPGLQVRS